MDSVLPPGAKVRFFSVIARYVSNAPRIQLGYQQAQASLPPSCSTAMRVAKPPSNPTTGPTCSPRTNSSAFSTASTWPCTRKPPTWAASRRAPSQYGKPNWRRSSRCLSASTRVKTLQLLSFVNMRLTFAPNRSIPRLQARSPARNPTLLLHVPLHHHRKQQQLRHQHKLQHLSAPTRSLSLRRSAPAVLEPNSPAQRPQGLHHRPLPHPHRPRHRLSLQIHRPLPRRPLPRPHRRRQHNRLPPPLHLGS